MSRRPNFLIFMTDQERADVVAPGHPCRTPNAERLAAEGVTFTHAFTPMAHCCPSRASFMTGMYPSKHKIMNNVQNTSAMHLSLDDSCETFSEKLRDSGYRLSYSGKWHVSATENPSDRGWEEVGPIGSTGTYGRFDSEGYLKMPREDTATRGRGEILQPGWGKWRLYGTADVAEKELGDCKVVQAGIGKMKELADGDDPWCVYIGTNGPHAPFVIPEKYATMYDPAAIDLPENYMDDMSTRPQLYQRMQKKYSQLTPDEAREAIAHYWGYCTMIDGWLGQALDALEATGQAENTVVIFCADHGEFCGSHGLYAKGIAPFDEAYRVPYVVRWPEGVTDPGRSIDAFITHADISPTLTEIAGAEATTDPSGRSFAPMLAGETPADWPDAFYNQCNGVEIYYTQRMVRTREYKLVYNPAGVDELYDLKADPHEMKNLIDDPAMEAVIKELFGKLWIKARAERDYMSSYHTCSHAPLGPAFALGKD